MTGAFAKRFPFITDSVSAAVIAYTARGSLICVFMSCEFLTLICSCPNLQRQHNKKLHPTANCTHHSNKAIIIVQQLWGNHFMHAS